MLLHRDLSSGIFFMIYIYIYIMNFSIFAKLIFFFFLDDMQLVLSDWLKDLNSFVTL